MNALTPPLHLFREIAETHELILGLLVADGTCVRHWPTYYQLYIDIDRIGWDVRRAGDCIATPLCGPEREPDAYAIRTANDAFSRVQQRQRAIVGWLEAWSLNEEMISVPDKASRHQLYCHFRPKSAWIETFFETYRAGSIAADGTRLENTVLLLDPQPSYRVPDLHDKHLVQHQSFDLATAAARAALHDAVRDVERRMGTVRLAMRRYLADHCSIAQLLDPSTF